MVAQSGGINVWLVRAGRGAEHFDAFIRDRRISIGWAEAALGDLSELPNEVLNDRLVIAYGRVTAPGFATQLLGFVDAVDVGDLVVTPDASARHLALGEVTGEYEHADGEPVVADHRHHRPVTWWGAWSRDALPVPMYRRWLNDQRTVIPLDDREAWLALAERIRAGEGLDLRELLQSGYRRANARPGAMTPGMPVRVCPSCGLTRAAALFETGEDTCRDCAW